MIFGGKILVTRAKSSWFNKSIGQVNFVIWKVNKILYISKCQVVLTQKSIKR